MVVVLFIKLERNVVWLVIKKINKVNIVKMGFDLIFVNKILFIRNLDKVGLVYYYNIFMDMEGFKEKKLGCLII